MTGTKVLRPADNGSTILVKVGTSVEIRLPEIPTTGYLWRLEAVTGPSLSAQDKLESVGPAPGSGGERVFSFSADSPGRRELRLALRRPWEPADRAIERFVVTLDVE